MAHLLNAARIGVNPVVDGVVATTLECGVTKYYYTLIVSYNVEEYGM